MRRTHKNINDDYYNYFFCLRTILCRHHKFPFTTNYNAVHPKNHYEVANKRPDGAFNRLVGVTNHFVTEIKYSVEAFNHLDKALKHLDETYNCLDKEINRLDEAIKYNLLHINTLQTTQATFRKGNNI